MNLAARRHDRSTPHELIDAGTFLLKFRKLATGELPLPGDLDLERIDEPAVDQDLVVEVGPRGETRGPDIADDLPPLDLDALLYTRGHSGPVAVGGLIACAIGDAHVVPISTLAV